MENFQPEIEFVLKNIKSCKTIMHLKGCRNLIKTFKKTNLGNPSTVDVLKACSYMKGALRMKTDEFGPNSQST